MDTAVPAFWRCVSFYATSGQGHCWAGFRPSLRRAAVPGDHSLGRDGEPAGKCVAVLVVVAIRFTLVAALGYGQA